jgi:hypothetical protein
MKTMEQLKAEGFDLYTFATKESAIDHEMRLAGCSLVDYVFETTEEVVNHHTLYVLAAKRISPTLKQQLKALETN